MTTPRSGMARLAEELALERAKVADRSPPYERALEHLPTVLEGAEGRYVAAAWEHRTFIVPGERAQLLLAALRADARAEGPGHPLYEGFGAPAPRAGAVTEAAIRAGLSPDRERVYDALAQRWVAIEEPARAVAWLWPAALAGASRGARPLAIAEVGARAGLNLVADSLPHGWTFTDGEEVEAARGVRTIARLGLDPAPLDALRPGDAEWLRSCVWPCDAERAARLEQALAAFVAARARPDAPVLLPIAARNAPARLDLLSGRVPDALVLAYQTHLRERLAQDERAEYEAGMIAWLATHPPGRALWVELEPARTGESSMIVAHAREVDGRVRTFELARCEPHLCELARDREAVEALRALLAPQGAAALPA
ncbi:DUF2332 family protein [Anaeromyxobacter oryzisoli]|uniref:DUF2332 family protein n=1 Tax=Anaeromyxobacter oryzisoli TaxID=2925408 RepID=UPI001F56188D|nr:DUF2332 family protein [Anaeromyxobacter sp. SG63]